LPRRKSKRKGKSRELVDVGELHPALCLPRRKEEEGRGGAVSRREVGEGKREKV